MYVSIKSIYIIYLCMYYMYSVYKLKKRYVFSELSERKQQYSLKRNPQTFAKLINFTKAQV